MYDSVYVFAKGLAAMDSGHSIKPTNLSCDVEKPWEDGLSLYNYLDSVVSFVLTVLRFSRKSNLYSFFLFLNFILLAVEDVPVRKMHRHRVRKTCRIYYFVAWELDKSSWKRRFPRKMNSPGFFYGNWVLHDSTLFYSRHCIIYNLIL